MVECPATPGSDDDDDDDAPKAPVVKTKEVLKIVQKRDLPPFRWLSKNKVAYQLTPPSYSHPRTLDGSSCAVRSTSSTPMKSTCATATRTRISAAMTRPAPTGPARCRLAATSRFQPAPACRAMNFECIKGFCPVEKAGFVCENQRFQHESWRPKIEAPASPPHHSCRAL
jgi:hypothetical protein